MCMAAILCTHNALSHVLLWRHVVCSSAMARLSDQDVCVHRDKDDAVRGPVSSESVHWVGVRDGQHHLVADQRFAPCLSMHGGRLTSVYNMFLNVSHELLY